MISAGRASRFKVPGGMVLSGSVGIDLTASTVAADPLTLGAERADDKEVEEDSRRPMILSIFL